MHLTFNCCTMLVKSINIPGNTTKGTIVFSNGDVYEGDIVDGKPHGNGTCTYKNGDVYEGEWEDGRRNGFGTMKCTCDNGYVYQYRGAWVDDEQHGYGTVTGANGDVYEGEMVDGKPHGRGKYIWVSGHMHVGEYKNGQKNGKGKFTWADGSMYDGVWEDDILIGKKGKIEFDNGDVYEGDILMGCLTAMERTHMQMAANTAASGKTVRRPVQLWNTPTLVCTKVHGRMLKHMATVL